MKMGKRVAGADEAGRGPVIGPLVIAGVVVGEDKVQELVGMGVRDSKRLSPKKREELFGRIMKVAEDVSVLELWPEEINSWGGTLNELEVEGFVRTLNSLRVKPDVVYVDAADVNEERFGTEISKGLKFKAKVIAEHGADAKFPVVSAASIVAKVVRDRGIEKLREEYGEIGSGYPSDPKTRKFLEDYLREHGDFPPIVRRKWKTLGKIRRKVEGEQRSLYDFLP